MVLLLCHASGCTVKQESALTSVALPQLCTELYWCKLVSNAVAASAQYQHLADSSCFSISLKKIWASGKCTIWQYAHKTFSCLFTRRVLGICRSTQGSGWLRPGHSYLPLHFFTIRVNSLTLRWCSCYKGKPQTHVYPCVPLLS